MGHGQDRGGSGAYPRDTGQTLRMGDQFITWYHNRICLAIFLIFLKKPATKSISCWPDHCAFLLKWGCPIISGFIFREQWAKSPVWPLSHKPDFLSQEKDIWQTSYRLSVNPIYLQLTIFCSLVPELAHLSVKSHSKEQTAWTHGE